MTTWPTVGARFRRHRDLLAATLLVAATGLAYYPALWQGARADQIIYLTQTFGIHGFKPFALDLYAFNRALQDGDHILFRPALYFVLGAERWAFGYHFMWWQACSISLHVLIVLMLYRLLRRLRPDDQLSAIALSLFFAVQYASMEMVDWHHIVGYLVFALLLMVALDQLIAVTARRSAWREGLLVLCLLVASFTYELGNAVAFTTALYMAAMQWRRPLLFERGSDDADEARFHRTAIVALELIPVIYVAWSLFDLYTRFGGIATAAGQVTRATSVIRPVAEIIFAAGAWLAAGLLPTILQLKVAARMEIGGATSAASLMTIGGAALAAIVCVALLGMAYHVMTRQWRRQWGPFAFLLGVWIAAYTAIIVFGRAAERGFIPVLANNSYYAYLPNLIAIPVAHIVVSAVPREFSSSRIRRWIFISALLAITAASGWRVYTQNVHMRDEYSAARLQLVARVDEFVQQHQSEPQFSFSVSSVCGADDRLPWLHVTRPPLGADYTMLEALFPAYYRLSGAHYRVTCTCDDVVIEKSGL